MKHWDILQIHPGGATHKIGMVIAGSYQAALREARKRNPGIDVDVEES